MKNRNIIAAAACLAGALGAGAAPNQFNGTPVVASFDRGTNFISIVDGGEGERASPTFFDWNGDGLPDLLEGYMGISDGVGYLNVFLNDGTKTSPHFTSGFESEVHVAGGWCSGVGSPQLVDLNNDGISDVVCGEHSTSVKYFLRDNSGNVTSSGTLVDDSGRTIPGDSLGNFATFTEPQIVDWNNDGLPDLVVTLSQYLNVNGYGGPGHMLLYLNTGTKEQYKFHFAGVICKQNGDTIESPAFMTAAVGDINNDGLFDIVVKDPGDYTGPATFAAYMNVGTMGSPLFADSVHIKSGDGTTNLTSDKFMNRFEIADWNGDGTNDIIADTNNGMCAGNIQVYMGIPGNVGVARKSLSTNVTSAMIFNRSQMRINLGSNLVNGGRLELVNSAGRRIFSTELTKGESFVDLGNLSKEMSKGFLYAILRHDGLEKSVPVMINSTR